MISKWASSLTLRGRTRPVVLAAMMLPFIVTSSVSAQQAVADVQLGSSGDQVLSDVVTLEAKAGDEVVIEIFGTGFSGLQGIEAILTADDGSAVLNPSFSAGSLYPIALPAISDGRYSGSFSIFGALPTESDNTLKFLGNLKFTLSSTFTAVQITLDTVKFGTEKTINPKQVITIANPGALPKTFFADLNGNPGNQNVVNGRANPSGRFGVQTFAGGLSDVDEVEIRVTVDQAQIDATATGFVPNSPFSVVPGAVRIRQPSASALTTVGVDIQKAADNTYSPEALVVKAEGGSTVQLEIFGEGYEGANGMSAVIRVSDPSAIAGLTATPSAHFNINLAEPVLSGDTIKFNLGNLFAPSSAPFQNVGTLNIALNPGFNGVTLEVLNVTFPPASAGGTTSAVLAITPPGGIKAPLVAVSGNDVVVRLSSATPVSGKVGMGRFIFKTQPSFSRTSLTFSQVSFISAKTPTTINPDFVINMKSNLSNAPVVSEPPAPVTVTDSRAVIGWATNRAGTGKVIYGTDPGNLNQEQSEPTSFRIHQVSLTGLQLGTRYFYQVITTDGAGNESDPFPARPLFFVTKRKPDNAPPRIVRGPAALGITTNSVTFLVETDELSTIDVLYGTSEADLNQTVSSSDDSKIHELTLTGLTPGATIFFTARATDALGNAATTPKVRKFKLRAAADELPPRIAGRPTVLGATSNAAVLRWLTTEPSTSKIRFGFEGTFSDSAESEELVSEHKISLSNLLADTIYTYQVESVDASGNGTTSANFKFRTRGEEDSIPPRITRPPMVARRSDTEALIVFEVNEPATATVQVGDNIAVASDTSGVEGESFTQSTAAKHQEVLLTNLDPATVYFYRIAVTDLSGNGPTYNRGQLSFATLGQADTKPPVIVSRPVAIGITEDGARINWGADEPHSATIHIRDEKTADDFDDAIEDLEFKRRHGVPISGLLAGTKYEYQIETVDAEGNSSTTALQTFTTRSGADTEAPTIVRGPSVVNITASSATVVWGTDEPSDTRVSWGTTTNYTEQIEDAEGVRFHSVTITDLEAATKYHYAVGSADASGNVVTTDASGTIVGLSRDHNFRTLATEDENPPVITEGPLAEIRNNLVVLKWRTDELATSRVAVGVAPGSEAAAVDGTPVFGAASQIVYEENRLRRRHVITVTGLTPGLGYLFQVSSTDAAGNTVSGSDPTLKKLQPPGGFGSFTTTTEADTQWPVITGGPTVVASTSESLTIEWSTDESSSAAIDFGASEASLGDQQVSTTNETTHRMVLTKLAIGKTYAYQVGSTDASGNGATKSAVVFGTTQAGEDLTAPVISTAPTVIYVNDRQATISWETSEAADSEVAFGTASDQLLETRNESDFNTNHSITLTNLTAGTTYYYTASSTDQNNNGPATSTVLEFSTESLPDTTPPTSSSISASATDTEALITWMTNELSDSAIRYGTTSGSLDFNTGDSEDVLEHSVALTNLTPATTYTYTVSSIDRAGNQGATSSELTFTTLAAGETPTLSAPTSLTATAGNGAVQLSWTASEAGGVVGVIVERESGDGNYSAIATLEEVTTYIDNNVQNGTTYTYQTKALGLNNVQSDASTASAAVTPAAGIGPSTPTLYVKQGNPLKPTFAVNNSTPLTEGDALNYTFQLSSSSDFLDAISLDSGLSEGAGMGSSDPVGVTAWTVGRELEDSVTYHYRIKASDGTFDSDFLTGSFTVNSDALPFPGDIDGDYTVGFGDFLNLISTFNKTSSDGDYNVGADFDASGTVDFTDFLTFVGAFGTTFIQGESASKPVVVALSYGIDNGTKLELVGRPTSSEAGGELAVEIHAKDVLNMRGSGLRFSYDTDALEFVEAYQGNDALLNSGERKAEIFGTLLHNPAKGDLFIAGAITEGAAVTGEGVVARLQFVLKTDHPQGNLINIVEGLIIDGKLNVSAAQNLGDRLALVPKDFALDHNFPNPFNPETTIRYAIPEASQVRLVVYNILGQEVARLVDKDQVPGFYALRWDGTDTFGRSVASGVYLYKIQAIGETQRFSQVHKMLLLK